MQVSQIGFTIFAVALIVALAYFRYSERSKPSLKKARRDIAVSLSTLAAEMIGAYMYGKPDAVMIVFSGVTLMFVVFSIQEFRQFRAPVKMVK